MSSHSLGGRSGCPGHHLLTPGRAHHGGGVTGEAKAVGPGPGGEAGGPAGERAEPGERVRSG